MLGKIFSLVKKSGDKHAAKHGDPTDVASNAIHGLSLAIIVMIPLFPLFNLPAFFPAGLLTAIIGKHVLSNIFDGNILIFSVLVTLVISTFFMWKVFQLVLLKISQAEEKTRKILNRIFCVYILCCYGSVGFFISIAAEANILVIIAATAIPAVLGFWYSSKKLNLKLN